MIVKIGDKKYDSEKEPIMIEMSIAERELIASMDQNATKYCSFPEGLSPEEVAKFMEIEVGDEVSEEETEEAAADEEKKPDGEAEDKADDGAAR